MSDRMEFVGKCPQADILYREMEKRLGGDLDGYDALALSFDAERLTGVLAVKWADGYASVDAYAPAFRPSRKVIKTFFAFVFARREVCLCVVRAGNARSADFVRRLGFVPVWASGSETLFKLSRECFEAKFFRRTYAN